MKTIPDILWEDEFLVAIQKPAKILSIPDRYDASKINCYDAIKNKYESLFIVHRLDKDTSGVLMFAKSKESHTRTNQLFEHNKIEKKYHALIEGNPILAEGKIDKPIAADPSKPGRMKVHAKGKACLTTYKIIENFMNFSWVQVQLHTGRTHQIRVHFASIGHPLAVDEFYGKRNKLSITDIKYNAKTGYEEIQPLIDRCTLHAYSINFIHPFTSETIHISAPLPKDLKAVINQLSKVTKK